MRLSFYVITVTCVKGEQVEILSDAAVHRSKGFDYLASK